MSGNTIKRPSVTPERVTGHFKSTLALDFFDLMAGEWLGGGVGRGGLCSGHRPVFGRQDRNRKPIIPEYCGVGGMEQHPARR